MASPLTAVSLFSGCGGFDFGAQRAGIEIVWANDIDARAAQAYRSLLPSVPFHEGDIRKVERFQRADVLIGCYPCTGFSQAAKRRNAKLEDRDLKKNPTNFLFQEFLRAVRQVMPKFLFVENVRGMLSASGGWFFGEQIRRFEESGYRMTHKLLDASHYGVPQARKRVFLVGVREDLHNAGFRYSFPEATHGPKAGENAPPLITLEDAIGDMEEWPEGEFNTKPFHGHYLTRNRKKMWSDPSYTIVAHEDHVTLHPSGEPMKRIGTDHWVLQGDLNRRLSWKECAVLQDLPLSIAPGGTLKDKYRVVGNSVPPKLGEVLLGPILAA
jgi:DNA (cytosine-5)-methyltransferase 1